MVVVAALGVNVVVALLASANIPPLSLSQPMKVLLPVGVALNDTLLPEQTSPGVTV